MTTTYVYTPKTTSFNNKGIQWFNDDQLIKREGGETMQIINLGNDVEQLIEEIERLTWCDGVIDWHITEEFPVNGKREYDIQGLKIELEDGIVICSDINDKLIEDISRVLNMFLVDSIVEIITHSCNYVELIFRNGLVKIEWNKHW